jgi:hypothetical protein
LTNLIQYYAPDIIGIQEVLLHLVESINKNLKYDKYLGGAEMMGTKPVNFNH